MTIYGTQSAPTGAPISPFQGTSPGLPSGVAAIALPAGMSMLEAMSRGILPRNLDLGSVNGVSTGALNPTPLDDLSSNGAGNQVNAGVAVAGISGNPATNGANNQESFVSGGGQGGAPAGLSTGPVPVNVETLTSCPVSGNTFCGNLTPYGVAGQPVFQG
jgi:hypothetical protein